MQGVLQVRGYSGGWWRSGDAFGSGRVSVVVVDCGAEQARVEEVCLG